MTMIDVTHLPAETRERLQREAAAAHKMAQISVAAVARREAEAKERADEIAAELEERRKAREQVLEDALKAKFRAAGGTEESWAKERPDLLRRYRAEVIFGEQQTADDRAKAVIQRHVLESF